MTYRRLVQIKFRGVTYSIYLLDFDAYYICLAYLTSTYVLKPLISAIYIPF
jgi:hypothetical protein